MPPGSLRHRFVVGGERSRGQDDETADRTRALRDLLSDGVLDKWVTLNLGGELRTVHLHQQGPIAFVESTTLNDVFAEDENRCLQLRIDESEAQTRRILEATARGAAGAAPGDPARTRQVHHAIARMVPRTDVVVPFAEAIGARFSGERVEARRELPQLLRLVKASALLHFRQRARDPNGRVIATRDDYALAARLAAAPLQFARGGLSPAAVGFFERLTSRFDTQQFSTAQARESELAKRRTVYGWLEDLNHAGLIEQTEPQRGNVPAKWRLTGREPSGAGGIVPAPSDVFRVSARTRPHSS
jgi:hypothetical protein